VYGRIFSTPRAHAKKSLNKNGSSVTSAASAREVLAMPTPVANMPADMTKATQATTQSKFRYKM
jgi:hypothetical protein